MSVKKQKNQKPLRPSNFGAPTCSCREKTKSISNETAPIDEILLKNILTGKLNIVVQENYGVEYHRIGEDSLPTWSFGPSGFKLLCKNQKKMFSIGSSLKVSSFDCDFDEINQAHTYGEKGV